MLSNDNLIRLSEVLCHPAYATLSFVLEDSFEER